MGDAGLDHVKELKVLESLMIDNTKVTDDGVNRLTGLKKLNFLKLDGTEVTPEGAGLLNAKLPQLRVLGVRVVFPAVNDLARDKAVALTVGV